jgi:hypothetical protein
MHRTTTVLAAAAAASAAQEDYRQQQQQQQQQAGATSVCPVVPIVPELSAGAKICSSILIKYTLAAAAMRQSHAAAA